MGHVYLGVTEILGCKMTFRDRMVISMYAFELCELYYTKCYDPMSHHNEIVLSHKYL